MKILNKEFEPALYISFDAGDIAVKIIQHRDVINFELTICEAEELVRVLVLEITKAKKAITEE